MRDATYLSFHLSSVNLTDNRLTGVAHGATAEPLTHTRNGRLMLVTADDARLRLHSSCTNRIYRFGQHISYHQFSWRVHNVQLLLLKS